MTAYLIFIALIVLLLCLDYISKREGYGLLTVLSVLAVILFSGLRYETGYDYLNYQYFFSDATTRQLFIDGIEPGFILVTALPKLLGLDPAWLFFVFSTAIIFFLFRGIRLYTVNVRIALLVFLLIPGLFLNSFSILRQSMAMVLLLNAYFYLQDKKPLKFWLFVLLAASFHYSALLVVPFYWLSTKLSNQARWVVLIGIPVSLILAQMNVLGLVVGVILGNSKFAAYMEYQDAGTSLVKLIVLNVSIIPYLIFYDRMDKMNRSLLVLLVFGLMLTNIFANVGAITRIAYYFKIFEIVLLGNLLIYFKAGLNRVLMCLLIFCYFFIMFYTSLSFDYNEVSEYPRLTPYKTIFEQ